jgi:hypothetical protein
MPQGTVFKLPGCTDDGTFAIALNRLWRHTHGGGGGVGGA